MLITSVHCSGLQQGLITFIFLPLPFYLYLFQSHNKDRKVGHSNDSSKENLFSSASWDQAQFKLCMVVAYIYIHGTGLAQNSNSIVILTYTYLKEVIDMHIATAPASPCLHPNPPKINKFLGAKPNL